MINNQNIGVLSEKVARLESDVKTLALPPVEAADEGKALIVNDAGAWEAAIIDADGVEYSEGVSVKDKIDETNNKMGGMVTCSATASESITVLANSTSNTNLTSMPTTPSGKSIIGFSIISDEGANILEKITYTGAGKYGIHAENRTANDYTVNVNYRVLYV